MNMVEMQAAVPAKAIKTDLSAPKAKTGSSSNSFSKHLQRLTRRSSGSESKDLQRSNTEAIAERSETGSNPFPTEQKVETLPVAQEFSTSQKPAEQEAPQESAASDETAAVGEIQPESDVQQAPGNIPLNDIPVLIAQETMPELPKVETVASVNQAADLGETSQNPGSANLLNELPQTVAQVAPLQEGVMPTVEEPEAQVGLQQPAIPETITPKPAPLLESQGPGLPIGNEAKMNDNDTVKPVTEPKLLQVMQDSLKESATLASDIPVQTDIAVDNQDKPAKVEEAMATTDGKQPAPEAAPVNESPAALMQSGLAVQPATKRTDSNNQGATTAFGDDTVSDAEAQAESSASTVGTESAKQADKTSESDKTSPSAGSKQSEARTGQSELKFRAVAGMEVVRPKTEQAATDVKKLIAFESKRLKSDKSEVMQAKSETAASSKPSEGESIALLAGKSGLESEKIQLLRSTPAPATTDLLAEPEKVLEQIVKKAEMMVKLNSSEMKIQLQPEFLGKMTIKIAVEEGMLTAKFITDSHQVKHMLDSNLNTLRQSLEAQGIRVEKTEVNVQLNNGGMFDGSGQNPQESWQRYQFMNEQYPRSFTGQGYETGTENLDNLDNDDLAVSAIPESEYGIGSNGTMNFLV
ncbi:MAG: flagellar hook-length control protein FliK [Syntrophomonas sp.]